MTTNKRYTIYETLPATQTWTYCVEAASEEEALDKVMKGEIYFDDYAVDGESDCDYSYEVSEY